MQCTRCKKILDFQDFSYKNAEKKIYYLHCNNCRQKVLNDKNKKQREKANYEKTKKEYSVTCECGVNYVGFRDYHILRHFNSKSHINWKFAKIIDESYKKLIITDDTDSA